MKNSRILLAGLGLVLAMSLGACSTFNAKKGHAGKAQMMSKNMKGKMCGGMMTAEMHEKMAKKHKKAAECLKSGKSQKECKPMMGKMKSCTMQGMADQNQKKEMSKEEHESHH